MKGYREITNEIIQKLSQGTIPWHQAWKSGLPANAVTHKAYRGVNIWLLATYQYQSNLWLTYNQARLLGGFVKRGEHGRQIVFWKLLEREDEETEEIETIPMLRTYTVFNLEQTTIESETRVVEPILSAQGIVDGYQGPAMEPGHPAYLPTTDTVTMPSITAFDTADEYYSTLFHELSHSTGHPSRLNRPLSTGFRTDSYAEEEVIAEMSASYLCAMAGTQVYVRTMENSAAYIQHWIKRFQDNDRLVVCLSSKAQRASDWILGITPHHAEPEPAMEEANL